MNKLINRQLNICMYIYYCYIAIYNILYIYIYIYIYPKYYSLPKRSLKGFLTRCLKAALLRPPRAVPPCLLRRFPQAPHISIFSKILRFSPDLNFPLNSDFECFVYFIYFVHFV